MHAEVFNELHRSDPVVTEWLARAVTAMPQVGTSSSAFTCWPNWARVPSAACTSVARASWPTASSS